MNKIKHPLASYVGVALGIFFIFGFSVFHLNSEISRWPKPLKIDGFVDSDYGYITSSTKHVGLGCDITLSIDSNPVAKARIRVDDRLTLAYKGNGRYRGSIEPYDLFPNRRVKITIGPEPSLSKDEGLVTAEGTITDIVEIISPLKNENIDLTRADVLTIRWRFQAGSGPISSIFISEGARTVVFDQFHVPGDSIDIPASRFKPNREYYITVSKSNRDFILKDKGYVTPDSRIRLSFEAITSFITFTTLR